MSSRNQYKALLTRVRQELRLSKKFIDKQTTDIAHLLKERDDERDTVKLLNQELKRIRLRKWWQFWKFFKRNQIIQ